jgi:hypothetical protein
MAEILPQDAEGGTQDHRGRGTGACARHFSDRLFDKHHSSPQHAIIGEGDGQPSALQMTLFPFMIQTLKALSAFEENANSWHSARMPQ